MCIWMLWLNWIKPFIVFYKCNLYTWLIYAGQYNKKCFSAKHFPLILDILNMFLLVFILKSIWAKEKTLEVLYFCLTICQYLVIKNNIYPCSLLLFKYQIIYSGAYLSNVKKSTDHQIWIANQEFSWLYLSFK